MSDTLKDILPERVRHYVYVVLAFASLAFTVVWSALRDGFQMDDVPVIITGLLSAGGFGMASANTSRH